MFSSPAGLLQCPENPQEGNTSHCGCSLLPALGAYGNNAGLYETYKQFVSCSSDNQRIWLPLIMAWFGCADFLQITPKHLDITSSLPSVIS
jgi:hypothetical protein